MKFKIGERETREEELEFWLELDDEGDILLICFRKGFGEWIILWICSETGVIRVMPHVSDSGLRTNERGEVEVI